MDWPMLCASLPAGIVIGLVASKLEKAFSLPSRVQPWPPEGCSGSSASAVTSAKLVKDRDPGSSGQLYRPDERSPGPEGSSLTHLDENSLREGGRDSSFVPAPRDLVGESGDDKGQGPLVLGQTRNPVVLWGSRS